MYIYIYIYTHIKHLLKYVFIFSIMTFIIIIIGCKAGLPRTESGCNGELEYRIPRLDVR